MFWRAQVRIKSTGLIAEDDVVNVWHFDSDLADNTPDEDTGVVFIDNDFEAIRSHLEAFYGSLTALYPDAVLVDGGTIKGYKVSDPPPRVPLREGTFVANWSATSPMPREIALCLSFQGEKVSGQPQARRRGRVYLGPLGFNTGTLVSGEHRPSAGTIATVKTAAENLLAAPAAGEPRWAVYSRTADLTQSLDQSFNDVVDGWIDDSYDIQRRRGKRPLAKTTFS